jgi:crotonobetainyl-CoA:carnitine CoA-transferase CaiB-like acyl-CoA transferase
VIRVANRASVDAHIGAAFVRLTRDEAAAKLRAANTAYGFVNDVAAFSHHPALRRVEVGTANGPVSLAAPPVLFSDGARALGPVPGIGAQSAAIREEFAAG